MDGEAKLPISNGSAARELRVTTVIDGVPTCVLMPVVALSDASGRMLPIGENSDRAVLAELRVISTLLALNLGIPTTNLPPLPNIDPWTP